MVPALFSLGFSDAVVNSVVNRKATSDKRKILLFCILFFLMGEKLSK